MFQIRAKMTTSKVSFSWPHAGDSVQVAGTFNDWKPADMARDGDGVWRLDLAGVEAGRHEFKFVVDGAWVHDGQQESVANEHGSHNNVVVVAVAANDNDKATAVSKEAPKPQIEVERKFSVPADYRSVLAKHGFKPVKAFDETLSDDYFDSCEYELMQADHWLRKRNGDWELKYPVRERFYNFRHLKGVNTNVFRLAPRPRRRATTPSTTRRPTPTTSAPLWTPSGPAWAASGRPSS